MDHRTEFLRWKNSGRLDDAMLRELAEMETDEERVALCFGSTLQFGTAGLRGIMAPGPACLNIFTVAQATQGMANLILGVDGAESGVAIAYDTRNRSELFAKTAAAVLAANGIRVFLFDEPRPTPELSFAIRAHGCRAGINITASHNPKEYNGYKAYWEDGAQLPPDHAATVSAEIAKIDMFDGVKTVTYEEALASGLITILSEDTDAAYLSAVKSVAIYPELITELSDELRIVYTPLHGTGRILVPRILRELGLKHLYTVEEQMIPDGNFPTVKKPNPESAEGVPRWERGRIPKAPRSTAIGTATPSCTTVRILFPPSSSLPQRKRTSAPPPSRIAIPRPSASSSVRIPARASPPSIWTTASGDRKSVV